MGVRRVWGWGWYCKESGDEVRVGGVETLWITSAQWGREPLRDEAEAQMAQGVDMDEVWRRTVPRRGR